MIHMNKSECLAVLMRGNPALGSKIETLDQFSHETGEFHIVEVTFGHIKDDVRDLYADVPDNVTPGPVTRAGYATYRVCNCHIQHEEAKKMNKANR